MPNTGVLVVPLPREYFLNKVIFIIIIRTMPCQGIVKIKKSQVQDLEKMDSVLSEDDD
mgnify:CR=1 FL=1